MNRPVVILAPYFRTLAEIFSERDLGRLRGLAEVVWGRDEPMPDELLDEHLPRAMAYVGTREHEMNAQRLERAERLKAIIEVAGAFPQVIDYEACFRRGIRVLSCAPAFAPQVAEMALAMGLAAGRGIVAAHEDFRRGDEEWQGDRALDFTAYRADIGFIGFGAIARELLRLLGPFRCTIRAYDPWLPESMIRDAGCLPASLDETLHQSRVVYILAVPTAENRGLISREKLALVPDGATVALMSRSHLVDFDALVEQVGSGRIQAAIDVFPEEPLGADHPVRFMDNVILSPHRAASIRRERQAIGRMVVDDLELMASGLPPQRLQAAQPELIPRRLGRR